MAATASTHTVCLCDVCAMGAVYDDWTSLDFYFSGPESDAEYGRRTAALESLYPVTMTDEHSNGYADCACCDETVIDGRLFISGEE